MSENHRIFIKQSLYQSAGLFLCLRRRLWSLVFDDFSAIEDGLDENRQVGYAGVSGQDSWMVVEKEVMVLLVEELDLRNERLKPEFLFH
jgi:hypothetical protein